MLRPALALLLLASALPGAAGATVCDPTAQVCYDHAESGSCRNMGSGHTEVRARNVMLGAPLVASWRASHSCVTSIRSDAWDANLTFGRDGATVHWESLPSRDQGILRVDVTGPSTSASTFWTKRDGKCELWTIGTVGAASVNDRRDCAAGPPPVPPVPWGIVLP